jgi:hypothetical protein
MDDAAEKNSVMDPPQSQRERNDGERKSAPTEKRHAHIAAPSYASFLYFFRCPPVPEAAFQLATPPR